MDSSFEARREQQNGHLARIWKELPRETARARHLRGLHHKLIHKASGGYLYIAASQPIAYSSVLAKHLEDQIIWLNLSPSMAN